MNICHSLYTILFVQTHGKFLKGSLPDWDSAQAKNETFLTTMEPLPFGTRVAVQLT